jgi:16S rRNA A1518/A1519 N6-dimethyltransferase RsmA/KsgA/DIM1 with predicted DNA glycosylase/AP lyase activity
MAAPLNNAPYSISSRLIVNLIGFSSVAGTDEEDRQCTYKRDIPARSCNQCCNGKAISIMHYVCVCL